MKETIEALEKLIQIKNDTIKELEKQIQLLKSQPPQVITFPNEPVYPHQPYYPLQPITTPIVNPSLPYGSITISDGTNIVFKSSENLPLGAIQLSSNSGGCTITNIGTNDLNSTDINHPSNQNITFTNAFTANCV